MNTTLQQKQADLSSPQKQKQGIAAVWKGFYDVWKEPAAICIQAYWRGYAKRKYLKAQHTGRLIKHLPRSSSKTRDTAARVIQRWWRGWQGRQEALERRQAVALLQRFWKGCLARKRLPALKRAWRIRQDAALTLQCCIRAWLANQDRSARQRKKQLSGWLEQRSAAWLGSLWTTTATSKEPVVRELCSRYAGLRECAAVAIQISWRHWLATRQKRNQRLELPANSCAQERNERQAPSSPHQASQASHMQAASSQLVPTSWQLATQGHPSMPSAFSPSTTQLHPLALPDVKHRGICSDQVQSYVARSQNQPKAPVALAPLNFGPSRSLPHPSGSLTLTPPPLGPLKVFSPASPPPALPAQSPNLQHSLSHKLSKMDPGQVGTRDPRPSPGQLKSWTSFPQPGSTNRSFKPGRTNTSTGPARPAPLSLNTGIAPAPTPAAKAKSDSSGATNSIKPQYQRLSLHTGLTSRKQAHVQTEHDDMSDLGSSGPDTEPKDVRKPGVPAHNVIHAQVMSVNRNCTFKSRR